MPPRKSQRPSKAMRPEEQLSSSPIEERLRIDIYLLTGRSMLPGLPRRVYLEELYNWKPFRFLDLPAEMRNRIYEPTLKHNTLTGDKAHAAILRTCKLVHKEASSILNAESLLHLAIRFSSASRDARLQYFANRSIELHMTSEVNSALGNLGRVHHISLTVGHPWGLQWPDDGIYLETFLGGFFTTMERVCLGLKTLEVKFEGACWSQLESVCEVDVVALMKGVKKLEWRGCVMKLDGLKEEVRKRFESGLLLEVDLFTGDEGQGEDAVNGKSLLDVASFADAGAAPNALEESADEENEE